MWRQDMYAHGWCDLILILYSFWVPVVWYFSNVPIRKQFAAELKVDEPTLSILVGGYGPIGNV